MCTHVRRVWPTLVPLVVVVVALCTAVLPAKPAAATTATRPAATVAAPSQAPLDPAFVRYLSRFPLGSPQWIASGLGYGEQPAPADFSYSAGLSQRAVHIRAYPASFDLRSSGKVSPVKDQGSLNACWAFATCGSLESCLLPAQPGLSFSEDNLVLGSGFDTGGNAYSLGGSIYKSTAYLARWAGPVYESEDPFGDGQTPPGLTARAHVQEVCWFPDRSSPTDNDAIKYAVSTYGATQVSMSWQGAQNGSSYYRNDPTTGTYAYYYDGTATTNHDVLVVGWDDAYPKTRFAAATPPAGDGAFLVKNSWGTAWGDQGYFWVSYYDSRFGMPNSSGASNPIAVFNGSQTTTNYADVYQYDPLGYVNCLGYNSPTAWFANAFTAQSTGDLAAVAFYTVTPGCTYEVYTGTSLDSKVLRASGTIATMGYHTVALPAPVRIGAGRPFVVAVKMTTSGYPYPIAMETPISGYSSAASAAAGQSYVSSDGSAWVDLTGYSTYASTNVCLKAFTASGPVTTIGGVPASGWSKSKTPITVTLAAEDPTASVTYTEYSLDGRAFAKGTRLVVGGIGAHTVAYRSADALGIIEPTQTTTVGLDPGRPTTVAYAGVAVKRGKTARFRFKVVDVTPAATVSLKVYRGTRLITTLRVGSLPTRSTQSFSWKCSLAKGTYTWKVCATDLAGNPQRVTGSKTLVVR